MIAVNDLHSIEPCYKVTNSQGYQVIADISLLMFFLNKHIQIIVHIHIDHFWCSEWYSKAYYGTCRIWISCDQALRRHCCDSYFMAVFFDATAERYSP